MFENDFKVGDIVLRARSNIASSGYSFEEVTVTEVGSCTCKVMRNNKFSSYSIFHCNPIGLIKLDQLEKANFNELDVMLLAKALYILGDNCYYSTYKKSPKNMFRHLNNKMVEPFPFYTMSKNEFEFQKRLELSSMKVLYSLKNNIIKYIFENEERYKKDVDNVYENIEKILKIEAV